MTTATTSPTIAAPNYAVTKVSAIREANAKEFDAGKHTVAVDRTLDEMPRVQEMNLSLRGQKRPDVDLVKDVTGYVVPPIPDKHIENIINDSPER